MDGIVVDATRDSLEGENNQPSLQLLGNWAIVAPAGCSLPSDTGLIFETAESWTQKETLPMEEER